MRAQAADAAARASAAADELTDDLVLGGPGALSVAMRPTAASVDALLMRADPMQRPWGVTLGPPTGERYYLTAPQHVGEHERSVVCAQAVVGFGFELAPGLSLPLVGLLVWLLPGHVMDAVPKVLLAVLGFLALSVSPRGGASHHRLAACARALDAQQLARVAERRDSCVQRTLAWFNLDGLRALPAPLAARGANARLEVGEVRRDERAGSWSWGFGMLCGPAWLGAIRTSKLSHGGNARCLELARPTADAVRVVFSEVQGQPWKAQFFTGLLWGTEHRGEGRQVVRTAVCERGPQDVVREPALGATGRILDGTHEFAGGLVDAAVSQIEQVQSHGAGWRWPFWLPRYKSFGVGHVRQHFTITRTQADGRAGRVALGVLGMDETPHGGRVQWRTRLSWQAPTDGAPTVTGVSCKADAATAPATVPWSIDVRVYLPWSSPKRRRALLQTLGLPQLFGAGETTTPEDGWRHDLQLHLHAHAPAAQLRRGPLPASRRQPLAWMGVGADRLGALGVFVHRALGACELDGTDGDEKQLLRALSVHGPGLFAALNAPSLDAGPMVLPEVRAHYGNTHVLAQDAGWHLARLGAGGAPGRAWLRRARKLARALDAEVHALLRDPLVAAMPAEPRARQLDALVALRDRLTEQVQAHAEETTPLLPYDVANAV